MGYRAAFFVDRTCIGVKSFNWLRRISDCVCNYWEDFNNDGALDSRKELVGYGKRRYGADESVTLVFGVRTDAKGRHARVKLFSPMLKILIRRNLRRLGGGRDERVTVG